jgi:hypothetical protein
MTLLSDTDGTAAEIFAAGIPHEDERFPVPFSELTQEERQTRERYEKMFDQDSETYDKKGKALLDIRNRRLYRETHDTFEVYCNDRLGITRGRANQLIRAVGVLINLDTTVSKPSSERQIRPLCGLTPQQQREAWDEAVKAANDGNPTPAMVDSAGNRFREPDPAPESEDWTLKDAIKHLKSTMYDISQEWPQQYLGAMVGQLRSLADELTKYGKLRP